MKFDVDKLFSPLKKRSSEDSRPTKRRKKKKVVGSLAVQIELPVMLGLAGVLISRQGLSRRYHHLRWRQSLPSLFPFVNFSQMHLKKQFLPRYMRML